MFTKEGLEEVNAELAAIPVKNKQYVQVTERIKGFRKLVPNGCIMTDIVEMSDGVVTMKASVYDESGTVLATGYAQEKETSSYINKTSFIENCETSAVGRALGFCGIGIDGSMASAEEVANAMLQQENMKQTISEKEAKVLSSMCKRKGLDVNETFPDGVENLTGEQYAKAVKRIGAMKDKE